MMNSCGSIKRSGFRAVPRLWKLVEETSIQTCIQRLYTGLRPASFQGRSLALGREDHNDY